MKQRADLYYFFALGNYLALLILFAIWAFFFETNPLVSFWTPLLARTGPIIFFLPGALKRSVRTFTWLSFALMLYICYGVAKAIEYPNTDGIFGILTTVFTLGVIIFAMLFIRASSQANLNAAVAEK